MLSKSHKELNCGGEKCATAFSEGLQKWALLSVHKLFSCHCSSDISCCGSSKVGIVDFYQLLTHWKLPKSYLITIRHLNKWGLLLSIWIVCLSLQEVSEYCADRSYSFVISPCRSKANNFPVLAVFRSCKIQFTLATHIRTLRGRGRWWAAPRKTSQNLS